MIGKDVTQILISLNYMIGGVMKFDGTFKQELFVANTLLGVYTLIAITMVMMSCDDVISKSEKTIFLCYKLHENFTDDYKLRSELYNLARHLKANVTKITAANFFEIIPKYLFRQILPTPSTHTGSFQNPITQGHSDTLEQSRRTDAGKDRTLPRWNREVATTRSRNSKH
ncbi:hypothetical protein Zmor_024010 [Zophobas morio]|uniref:Uncharacterized protein n=1 Tax=Zophobas morio TaxID=2755281 RepID=A0AA38I116_9CUCU|nr:hypothetical protein Zmor_024010 [Zophobas morio]